MPTLPETLYPRTRERVTAWAADPDVVGVIWVGSKSRGHGDAMSDDDLEVFLTPEAFARLAPVDSYEVERDPVAEPPRLIYDAQLTGLEVLQAKAGSVRDLDHWPYEKAPVLFDRDGRVTAAVQAAAAMDNEFRRARILHGALDTTLAIGRARKTGLRGFDGTTALLIARGAKALSRAVFALEHRWVPLDHWLEPELKTLTDAAGAGPLLVQALREARPEPLVEALERLQPQLAEVGFPEKSGYLTFFSEMMHPVNAEERAIHGLN
jgi:hypothetical protein